MLFANDAVTVCIPTIPPRDALLARAVASVQRQVFGACAMSIASDIGREGAPATRQRALDVVKTPWVAFLDDDDELLPYHLYKLMIHQMRTGADYLYAWYQIIDSDGNQQPDTVLGHYGKPFDPEHPHQTTITTLVRTELAKSVGFLLSPDAAEIGGQRAGEDFAFTLGCIKAGAKIEHVPAITWNWHHHGRNTSGLPHRW